VDQRALHHHHQQRLQQPGAGLRQQPALGSLGAHLEFAATLTKVQGNHTIKFGGNWRHNSDKLLQTQDNQGPRGGFTFSGARTGSTANTAANSGIANAFASFLLDLPSGMARDLKVLDDVGSQHWAFYTFVHDKWQSVAADDVDLGLRWECTIRSLASPGRDRCPATIRRPTHCSCRATGTSRRLRGQEGFQQLQSPPERRFRLDDKTVIRGGFGASTTVPDNRYFNCGQAEQQLPDAEHVYADAVQHGRPASRRRLAIPDNGIIAPTPCWGSRSSTSRTTSSRVLSTRGTVAFQREIAWGLTGEVAYVRNTSNDVLNRFPMNASHDGRHRDCRAATLRQCGKTARVSRTWRGRARRATTAFR
jgi:hypothetical protein